MKIRSLLATTALIILPLTSSAQPVVDGVKLIGPGRFAGAIEETATLTVMAIDPTSRIVILKRANGQQLEVTVADVVKNFDHIKVGDNVVSHHTQALILELIKGGSGIRERGESSDAGSAKAGEKPAAYEAKKISFVADVQKVDMKKHVVTLRGVKNTVLLKINDPEQLKLIKKGDQIEGVYAEAVSISVEAAPAKAKAKK